MLDPNGRTATLSPLEARMLTILRTSRRSLTELQDALGREFPPGEVEDTAQALNDLGLLAARKASCSPWRCLYGTTAAGGKALNNHIQAATAGRPLRTVP